MIDETQRRCTIDWNKFMDEEEAEKASKGIVDEDDGYGKFGGMGDDSSDEDDSDDEPIDVLDDDLKQEVNDVFNENDALLKKEEVEVDIDIPDIDDDTKQVNSAVKAQVTTKEPVVNDTVVEKVCNESSDTQPEEEPAEIDTSLVTDV